MQSIRSRKAFTMIELIVVIVIIGILAAIAVVGYGAVIDRAELEAAEQTGLSVGKEAIALAAFDHGTDPYTQVDEALADIDGAVLHEDDAVDTVTNNELRVGDYKVTLTLDGTAVTAVAVADPAA